jgi:predicted RNA-binding protein with PUA-like domain
MIEILKVLIVVVLIILGICVFCIFYSNKIEKQKINSLKQYCENNYLDEADFNKCMKFYETK